MVQSTIYLLGALLVYDKNKDKKHFYLASAKKNI